MKEYPVADACAFGVPLTDNELMAFLSGEADEMMDKHLQVCPACSERAKEYAALQKTLTRTLFRRDCPESLQLSEYHMGFLSPEQAVAVREHVNVCSHCAAELADLAAFVEVEPLPAASAVTLKQNLQILWDTFDAQRIVGRFFAGENARTVQLVAIPVKGHLRQSDELYRFSIAPDDQTDIDAEFVIYQQDNPALVVLQVEATIPSLWPQARALQVTLTGTDWMQSQTTVENDRVVFPNIRRDELPSISFEITPVAP